MGNMDQENITFRVPRKQRANSVDNLMNMSLFESTRTSLPDLSMCDQTEMVTMLHNKVVALETELSSANNEVDHLLSENEILKKDLEKKNQLIEVLKKIEYSDGHSTPVHGRKRKIPRYSVTDNNLDNFRLSNQLQNSISHNFIVDENKAQELQKEREQLKLWLEEEKKKNLVSEKGEENICFLRKSKLTNTRKNNKKCKNKKVKTRTLMKTVQKLTNSIKCLQSKRLHLKREQKELKEKIKELHKAPEPSKSTCASSRQAIIKNTITTYAERKSDSRVLLLSDEIGKGVATKIIDGISIGSILYNDYKPGGDIVRMLENFEEKTKHLKQGDVVVILCSNYVNQSLSTNHYINLLDNILSEKKRQFNVIVSGMRYNGRNNKEIYKINRNIARIAKYNENVQFLEINPLENVYESYKKTQKRAVHNIITSLSNKFQGSSSLKYIHTVELDTNASETKTVCTDVPVSVSAKTFFRE